MPREFFGSVTDPSARGTTRTSTVILSFTAHAVVLMLLVVVPLMATGVLPVPKAGPMVLSVQPVVVPAPPPIRHAAPQPAVNRNAAPVDAPQGVTPEPTIAAGFENSATVDIGTVGGFNTSPIEEYVPAPPPPPAAPPAPVRVGGMIRQPTKVQDAAPIYPPLALAVRIEGIVIIEATIGVDGHVQNARTLRGHPQLEAAALDAVRRWVYTPTLLNGVPVPVIMTVTVQFSLQR